MNTFNNAIIFISEEEASFRAATFQEASFQGASFREASSQEASCLAASFPGAFPASFKAAERKLFDSTIQQPLALFASKAP